MRLPTLSVVALLLVAGAGCGDDAGQPTGPESSPLSAVATAEATAAVPLSFVQISAGAEHACGVASDGKAWCWGDGTNGQLGDGTEVGKLTPVAVAAP